MADPAASGALVEQQAPALASPRPTGAIFLSKNGRRGRVLTVAGQVTAGIAVLWVAALVAGALGVATPGILRLPGLGQRSEQPVAPAAAPRAAHVGAVRHAAAAPLPAVHGANATPSPAAPRAAAPADRSNAIGSARRSDGASRHQAATGTGSIPHRQQSTGTVGTTVSHQTSNGTGSASSKSRRTTASGSSVSANTQATHGAGGSGSTAPPAATATPARGTPPIDPGNAAKPVRG
jgi:hypothetical protein